MGFRVNVPKSTLTPTQTLVWLGMEWDTARARLRLSPENASKIHRRLFRASVSRTMTRRQWEAILGSLNFAAEVCPLGRIRHRRLVREINSAIPIYPRTPSSRSLVTLPSCYDLGSPTTVSNSGLRGFLHHHKSESQRTPQTWVGVTSPPWATKGKAGG
ncbi:hypothetical protein E2C01_053103 [Portunus trituberculatus]|uniref:Uncharacterized protein n=1 Tax=Portunus trituberculatus TaxID=210409 RepID=A0A5B7GPX0_PORTR|nr:hypothetical protein [Portunus trituberculatus]